MRPDILFGAFAASFVTAAPVDPPKLTKDTVPGLKVLPPPLHAKLFDSNGKLQSVTSNLPNVPLPKSTVPEVQLEPSKVFNDTIRKKIRYGPYRLPPTGESNWQKKAMDLAGMADEYVFNITKPCKECLIASLSANLEYADGTSSKSSAWLHHSVLVVAGPKVKDPICGDSRTETIFSSGNERSTVKYTVHEQGIDAGYRLHQEDTMTMVGEFKNELETEQYVWLAISYEIYDGPRPEFRDSHIIWLNVGSNLNCNSKEPNPFGASNLTKSGVPKSLIFAESTNPWTSPIDATLMGVGGHLHDGGTSIDFYKNGARICEAKAKYGSGAAAAAGAMGSHHAAGDHITGMESCHLMSTLKKNDRFWLTANYNLTQFQGSKTETGQLDEVMGVGTLMLIT